MRVYSHLPGYLHRWRLLGAGRFMLRLHRILSPDGTPFLHTHPFWYVSVVLRGGYTERFLRSDGTLAERRHGPGAVIVRRPDTAHRIDSVRPGCTTLFFSWKVAGGWKLFRHPHVQAPAAYWEAPTGLYQTAFGELYRFRGKWLRPGSSLPSIHQDVRPETSSLVTPTPSRKP